MQHAADLPSAHSVTAHFHLWLTHCRRKMHSTSSQFSKCYYTVLSVCLPAAMPLLTMWDAGISVLGFMITLWTLLRGKLWSQVNKLVLVFAVLLFAFQTMVCPFYLATIRLLIGSSRTQYTAVGIRRRYYGFVTLSGSSYPGGPSAFFENVTTTAVLQRNISWDLQVALGDAIVV